MPHGILQQSRGSCCLGPAAKNPNEGQLFKIEFFRLPFTASFPFAGSLEKLAFEQLFPLEDQSSHLTVNCEKSHLCWLGPTLDAFLSRISSMTL